MPVAVGLVAWCSNLSRYSINSISIDELTVQID